MPRIPDVLQQSIAFIYPDDDAARNGSPVGGTGFFITEYHSPAIAWLVTNIHVAQSSDRSIRVGTKARGYSFLQVSGSEWVNHPHGDDVSVAAVNLDPSWGVSALEWRDFALSPDRMLELNMGVGDDVFMIGRFISHHGKSVEQPLARFGNIAMMPGPLVRDGRNIEVEAFLVEMRSIAGYSGSPVFVYMGPGTYRGDGRMMPFFSETIGLMGIDTGHKRMLAEVRRHGQIEQAEIDVYLNTAVAIVSPAWKVGQVLEEAVR